MKPKISECEKKQRELLRPRLDSFLNMKHELVHFRLHRGKVSISSYFYEFTSASGSRPHLFEIPIQLIR